MPVYAYRCKICSHEFEIRQKFSDDRIQVCPVCEGETRRVIHHVPVVFKGSGFYVTDNRNGKGPGKTSSTIKKEAESGDKESEKVPAKEESAKNKKVETESSSK